MAHQHVRLVDIASRAGVSISAVSKALQDKSEIAPETKERIMAIAKEMGYQPNTMARSLRLGRSDLIGVIIPDNTNPYYSYILKGIEEKAKENGFTIIITNTMEDAETERQSIHTIVGSSVAGILAVPVNLKNYKDLSTPVLFLSRFPYREYSGYNKNNIPVWEQQSYILSDDFEGQRIATEHLIDKGLRDIYLCLDTNSLDTVRGVKTRIRLEGYRNALEIAGIPYDKNKVLLI